MFHERGYAGDILTGEVDQQTYYRIVFGQYASREAASRAREQLNHLLPRDAWLLVLKPNMSLLPRTEWLPLSLPVPGGPAVKEPATTESAQRSMDSDAGIARSAFTKSDIVASQSSEGPDERSDGAESGQIVLEEANQSASPSPGSFLRRHFGVELQFSNIYEDNIDHDEAFEAVQSYGLVPALKARVRSSASDPLLTLEYTVARHKYSNTERWDRVSHAFRGVFEPEVSDAVHFKTEVELSLKGNSEDRDISDQFQVVQEFEYRFSRRHRLQLYGTYRVKRFPDVPGAKDFKPNVGINFERTNSDGERFESGARYEFNKEKEIRGNYRRWTFTVEYRTPEINGRNQFEVGVKHRRKFYTARFIEIEDEDFLRQDNRLTIEAVWIRRFKRGVSMELGYEYETRGSNDPDKLYEANAFMLAMIYTL